jgi:hypothetical protein
MALQIGKGPLVVAILKRIDAVLFTLPEGVADAFRGIPIAHQLVKQLVKVGIPIELVAADDQATDLVLVETDFRKTYTHGLLRAACKGPRR